MASRSRYVYLLAEHHDGTELETDCALLGAWPSCPASRCRGPGAETAAGWSAFLRELCDRRQLLRNYTQNIDDLERKAGLCTDLERGVGVECVQLHGTLGCLRCAYCSMRVSWDKDDREAVTMMGQSTSLPIVLSCI
ncbi:hypothetical protein F4778DRAFT_729052 [Xylariomycetidae sp. FL2044]|nr:hypothetical protein F4778DRAFT_729052 [Xylariomycetidae sp. FL2044]